MLEKLTSSLSEDIEPLLPPGIRFSEEDAVAAFNKVWTVLITNLRGEAWKLTSKVVDEIRQKKFPQLLK
jgi:hypothetical protein